jgi:cytochrome P450
VIGIHHYAFYRNPNFYQLPDSFIPERWQDDLQFHSDAKKAFQPFSFGPRNCIGKKYVNQKSTKNSNLETKVVAVLHTQRCD